MKIAPSILAADALNLERDIRKVVDGGCDWLHIDVMDAHFVPNLAYAPETVRRLKEVFSVPLDVHLMMDQPEKYISVFLEAGANILTIHAEAYGEAENGILPQGGRIRDLMRRIRSTGAKAGLAVKPGTGMEAVIPFLENADLILMMTVEPGFGGQKLHSEVAEKIRKLREIGYTGEIEADGGITEENLSMLEENGLSVAVMGTSVFHSENPGETIQRLKKTGKKNGHEE